MVTLAYVTAVLPLVMLALGASMPTLFSRLTHRHHTAQAHARIVVRATNLVLPAMRPAGYVETQVHVLARKARIAKRYVGGAL